MSVKDGSSLFKQAQEMQAKMQDMQARLDEAEVTGVAGAGLVTVTLSGKGTLRKIHIDRSVVDADDVALISEMDGADLVYFTGGNPSHLLDVLQGSLLLEKLNELLQRDGILAGSSAGAMVMGSWMRFREWRETLGIVPDVAALPHHERSAPEETSAELTANAPADLWALGIDGATGCLSGPDGWTVLGDGNVTVYRNGDWRRYASGDSFVLS